MFFVSCSDPTLSDLGVGKGLGDTAGTQLTHTDQRNIPYHETSCSVVKSLGSLSKATKERLLRELLGISLLVGRGK